MTKATKSAPAPAASSDLFQIVNAAKIGQLVYRWAKDRSTAPRTIGELRNQVGTHMVVPNRLGNATPIDIVQTDATHYVLELPDLKMFEKGKTEIGNLGPTDEYPVPPYYFDKAVCVSDKADCNCVIKNNKHPPSHEDFLFTRLADYTFSVCR